MCNATEFNIAKELLHAPNTKISLDTRTIEDICLACSREFYDNSSSGNYNFGDMNIAYNW
jgi:neuroblastoma-amplified sequence